MPCYYTGSAAGDAALKADGERLRAALRIIAGYEQCIDNLMSNVEIARAALTTPEQEKQT